MNLFSKLFLLAIPLVGLLSACGGLSESRQIPQLTQENVNSFIVEQKKIIRENEDNAEDCNSTILSSLLKTDGIDFLRSSRSFFNFLSDFSIGNVNGAIIGSCVTSFN